MAKSKRIILLCAAFVLICAIFLVEIAPRVLAKPAPPSEVKISQQDHWTHYEFPAPGIKELPIRSVPYCPNCISFIYTQEPFLWVASPDSKFFGAWRLDLQSGKWENFASLPVIEARERTIGLMELYEEFKRGNEFETLKKALKNKTIDFYGNGIIMKNKLWMPITELVGELNSFGKRSRVPSGIALYDFGKHKLVLYTRGSGISLSELPKRANYEAWISCLVADGDNLWAGTCYHGVFRYDSTTDKWDHLAILKEEMCGKYQVLGIVAATHRVYLIPNAVGHYSAGGLLRPIDYIITYNKQNKKIENMKLPSPLAICSATAEGKKVYFGIIDGSVWSYNEETDQWREILRGSGHQDDIHAFDDAVLSIKFAKAYIVVGTRRGLFMSKR
jgi:hypothetical protein